jgi:hypothetical protein
MDSTANEVDGVNIEGFPTLKFYPANNKTPMDFKGDRTAEGFYSFLDTSTSKVVKFNFDVLLGRAEPEEEEEEEEEKGGDDDGEGSDSEKEDL